MAAKVLRSLNLLLKRPNKFESFLRYSWITQKQCYFQIQPVSNDTRSNHQKSSGREDNFNKYGAIFAALTSFYFFLYSYRDKWKPSWNLIPTVHAIERTESSLRKRFNFIADVVEKSASAVVCIESRMLLRGGIQNVVPGGSGFIVKDDGLILTSAHVVVNRPHSVVQVKLKDGRIFTGQIEDVDLTADLATIRIKANSLPVLDLGSSVDLRAGEWVVAIGSPLSLTDSVSAGVVSSPQRKGEDLGTNFKDMQYIQTDAAITFGNSGGPLVNLDGEVVGVNSMKVTPGISFAVPIEYAKEFLKRSEEKRISEGDPNVTHSRPKGYIGVTMLTLTPELIRELNHKNHQIPEYLFNGILICQVIIGSPAFNSGLQPGDVIAEINGETVTGVKSLYKALQLGIFLNMKIFRKGEELNVVIAPEQIV